MPCKDHVYELFYDILALDFGMPIKIKYVSKEKHVLRDKSTMHCALAPQI